MTTKPPKLISDSNLSYAWGRAFLAAMEPSKKEYCPLMISIDGFNNSLPIEDERIRQSLDNILLSQEKCVSSVSAMTIFPYKIWNIKGNPDISKFSDFYINEYLPRLKARDSRNQYGTYFERMIAFQGAKRKNDKPEIVMVNQLRHIIDNWNKERQHPKRPRQSSLQVSCFDPAKDHTGQPVRGFPCLQQISFTYDDEDGLTVNAYYPTQFILDRAYGNYLGLCHLGYFMAAQLGLKLVRLNCFIGHPDLGNKVNKNDLKEFKELVSSSVLPLVEQLS